MVIGLGYGVVAQRRGPQKGPTEGDPVLALTTAAAPDRPNHDVVLAGAELAVIVDGAGGESGACRHDVPWYARQLATQTMVALVDEPDVTLVEGLARGLHAVSRLHVYTCDLRSSGTPYAAIGIV